MDTNSLIHAGGTIVIVGGVYFVLNKKINSVTERFQSTLEAVDTNDKLIKELLKKTEAQQEKIEALEKIIVGHANFLLGLARFVEYPPVVQASPSNTPSAGAPIPEKAAHEIDPLRTQFRGPQPSTLPSRDISTAVAEAGKKNVVPQVHAAAPKKGPTPIDTPSRVEDEITSDLEAQIQKALQDEIAKLDSPSPKKKEVEVFVEAARSPRAQSSESLKDRSDRSSPDLPLPTRKAAPGRAGNPRPEGSREGSRVDSGSEPESIEILTTKVKTSQIPKGSQKLYEYPEGSQPSGQKKVIEVDPPTRKVVRKRMVNGEIR